MGFEDAKIASYEASAQMKAARDSMRFHQQVSHNLSLKHSVSSAFSSIFDEFPWCFQAMMAHAPTCATRGIFGCGMNLSVLIALKSHSDICFHSLKFIATFDFYYVVLASPLCESNEHTDDLRCRWPRFLQLLQGHPRGQPCCLHVNCLFLMRRNSAPTQRTLP